MFINYNQMHWAHNDAYDINIIYKTKTSQTINNK